MIAMSAVGTPARPFLTAPESSVFIEFHLLGVLYPMKAGAGALDHHGVLESPTAEGA